MKAKLEEDDRRPSFEFRCRSIATYAMRHQNLTSKFPANLLAPTTTLQCTIMFVSVQTTRHS